MMYSPSPANLKRSRVKMNLTYQNLSMLDREAKGMKKIMTAIFRKQTMAARRAPIEEDREDLKSSGTTSSYMNLLLLNPTRRM
mmetsp:Transcript_2850/g.1950  ORF Transcript_2850/g.1950 Transcript_2850/m.1950 type:complete len:83 (-) Transcript_2850:6-254(-)